MLKTLRIASIMAAVIAVCVVILVAVFGLKGDPEIQAYLDKEGVIEEYTQKAGDVPTKEDAVSPLVVQAQKFALRIDPPPPPPPPRPKTPPKSSEPIVAKATPQPPAPPRRTTPPISSTYTLMGTAMYPEHPERSMALLKDVRNKYQWYRQGETAGYFVVQEIRDRSVVLFQNGVKSSELTMPESDKIKSLLKNEETAAAVKIPSVAESRQVPVPRPPQRNIPTRNMANRNQLTNSSAPARSQPSAVRRRVPPPVPTREKQIESIDDSISSIQEIMAKETEGMSDAEQEASQAAWNDLIKILQEEKDNLEKTQPENPPDKN